eukprot:342043-Hanusia_phi.AAC.1
MNSKGSSFRSSTARARTQPLVQSRTRTKQPSRACSVAQSSATGGGQGAGDMWMSLPAAR